MDERPTDVPDTIEELQESLDAADPAEAPDIAEHIAAALGDRLDPGEPSTEPAGEEATP
jgi:hypothetical protein